MADVILVSAADAAYFPLYADLVSSLERRGATARCDLGLLDLGLDPTQRATLTRLGVRRVVPGWDVEPAAHVPVPDHYRAMTARPFLTRHFPDHRTIFWLDADIWVQETEWLDLFVAGARRHGFCIVPELDRAYGSLYGDNPARQGHRAAYVACFGELSADKLMSHPVLNSGAFAADRDSPIWGRWQEFARAAIATAPHKHAEQVALNAAVYAGGAAHFLPAPANWICSLARPLWDPGLRRLVEPMLPHAPLGLIHLAGVTGAVDLGTPDGGHLRTGLAYGEMHRRIAGH